MADIKKEEKKQRFASLKLQVNTIPADNVGGADQVVFMMNRQGALMNSNDVLDWSQFTEEDKEQILRTVEILINKVKEKA